MTGFGYSTEDNNIKSASGTDGADHMGEAGTTEKVCEISIQLEKTPRVDQYLQTIVNKRQEVSSLTLEGVEAVACIEEQEKDEVAVAPNSRWRQDLSTFY